MPKGQPFTVITEKELLKYLTDGDAIKTIAHRHKLTIRSISCQLQKLRRKYNCINTYQLILYAAKNELL